MTEPLPVTDEDVKAAYDAYFANGDSAAVKADKYLDADLQAWIRRVLEVDRKRVLGA